MSGFLTEISSYRTIQGIDFFGSRCGYFRSRTMDLELVPANLDDLYPKAPRPSVDDDPLLLLPPAEALALKVLYGSGRDTIRQIPPVRPNAALERAKTSALRRLYLHRVHRHRAPENRDTQPQSDAPAE